MAKMRAAVGAALVAVAVFAAVAAAAASAGPVGPAAATSGNPILPGWYADPEAAVFGSTYWIFPTRSAPYAEQTGFDAFSSPDLVQWTRHRNVLTTDAIAWAREALWAPSVVERDGRYYFFFSANDIKSDQELGGIGVAVADRPEGPYRDLLGKPLIGTFHNGAQPIDQFVFEDDDGAWYMIYGGWKHANIVRLKDDFTGVQPHEDGTLYKEITPAPEYVEGSLMFKRGGRYYYMWSEGGWGEPEYSVAYAIADKPTGPFKRIGKILQQDPTIATSAGHHSVIHAPGSDNWYIVYHRRPLGETSRHHRATAIDRMYFDEKGLILPVRMTMEGVPAERLDAR
ncbi:MAG: glycoside hydrolase family 43 protein [Stenotrophomonas sp.]|uniref:glycoside hydrolase family 43 protein n=1 Tax=Stenotrophomonas sp. TaxID=69392 RepID=UPI0029AFD3F3|nr:glycoside hydrolase family 43 protein [Stenotrophomonas sp.]MDX3931841.1 glycoside hydrolase family 43 protein [Stenotrophomonas sp.]